MSLPVALPTGTVTFLFTDVEGSTRLWEDHPEAMRPALAAHDRILRDAVAGTGGLVFKTIGDAFCAAFGTAPDGLAAALAAQQALAREPWPDGVVLRVRMALHTGTAEERDGDYFGQPLNRVARLLAAGHGDQTLVSEVTQGLTRDALLPSVGLLDLGDRRLKDLGRPERVFQLLHPSLPAEFPPLRSLDNPDLPNNLPPQMTSFIGREKEVAEVKALIGRARLVTLTGMGGTGKSRLSLQVAADLLDGSGDGVWLVELAALTDPALVPQAVADALGVGEEPGVPVRRALVDFLKARRLLLVLDNAEHVLAACAALVNDVLRVCPSVSVLASSREALGVPGEQTYRVPSLSLPDPKKPQTVESLSQFEAVRLFIERARLVQSAFAVTDENAPALAEVCHRLDGIPLALELAAARARTLTVPDINARLDSRFRLLTGGARTALPRQQTLRALIDWSYDLLNDREKAVLLRLSVFAGGWDLPAAEAVCVGDDVEDWEVLDLLTSLADKSLVAAETQGAGTRYRLLETIRQYAGDRLRENGEAAETGVRHRDYFLALAEEAAPQMNGPEAGAALARLRTEYENLRAALVWCREEEGGTQPGLRLAGALARFWETNGALAEGRERIGGALSAPGADAPTAPRAWALVGAGRLAYRQADQEEARRLAAEGLALSEAVNDRPGQAAATRLLGAIAASRGAEDEARSWTERALTLYREEGDKNGVAAMLNNLAILASESGDMGTANALYREALALHREAGDQLGVALLLSNLGDLACDTGDLAGARHWSEEGLTLCRSLGDRSGEGYALAVLGRVALREGETAEARARITEGLALFREVGEKEQGVSLLENCAALRLAEGEADRAVRLLGAASALRNAIDVPQSPQDRAGAEATEAGARAVLSTAPRTGRRGRRARS